MAKKPPSKLAIISAQGVAKLARSMGAWSDAARHRMARAVYRIALPLAKRRLHIARTNLTLCFPEWTQAQREQVVREQFRLFVQSGIDRSLFWFGEADGLHTHMAQVDRQYLDAALAQNRPVILLAPHFVGLDAGGIVLNMELELVSMFQRQSNPVLNQLTIDGRTRSGRVHLYSRQDKAIKLVKLLRKNIPLYYLPDLDFGGSNAMFAPFFGQPAMTLTTLPKLAQMTQALVVPCVTRIDKAALARGQTRYEMQFYPAWEGYPQSGEEEAVRMMNAFIEERIIEDPAQYLWMHKRFKTRPEGMAGVY